MKNYFILLFLLVTIPAFAQDEQTVDSTDRWDDYEVEKDYEAEWDIDDNFKYGFFGRKNSYESNKPTIDIFYTNVMPFYERNDFSGDFNTQNGVEIRLGLRSQHKFPPTENIYEFDQEFFSFMYSESELFGTEQIDIYGDYLQFTLGDMGGYGYRIGKDMSFTFYNGNGITFSVNNYDDIRNSEKPEDIQTVRDGEVLFDKFTDDYHFGGNFVGGVRFRPIPAIGLSLEYESNAQFRRHMFWYWAASEIIHGAAHGFLNIFIEKVGESSPQILPIVHFLLKNALDYGFFELRKSRMNWPIDTEEPFMINQFKVGLSLNM